MCMLVCVKTTFWKFLIRHVLMEKVHRGQDTLKFTVASDLHERHPGCDTLFTLMEEYLFGATKQTHLKQKQKQKPKPTTTKKNGQMWYCSVPHWLCVCNKAWLSMLPELKDFQLCHSCLSDETASLGENHHMKLHFKFSDAESVEHDTKGQLSGAPETKNFASRSRVWSCCLLHKEPYVRSI